MIEAIIIGFVIVACIGLVAAVAFALAVKPPKPWPYEQVVCGCQHDYYDHAHFMHGGPCAVLNCSCRGWDPTNKENAK